MLLLPVGLGLFGAALEHKLHYMVLALSNFLSAFCENVAFPVSINYVVGNFVGYASEVTTMLNFYRLILSLLVPFLINDWQRRVGVG